MTSMQKKIIYYIMYIVKELYNQSNPVYINRDIHDFSDIEHLFHQLAYYTFEFCDIDYDYYDESVYCFYGGTIEEWFNQLDELRNSDEQSFKKHYTKIEKYIYDQLSNIASYDCGNLGYEFGDFDSPQLIVQNIPCGECEKCMGEFPISLLRIKKFMQQDIEEIKKEIKDKGGYR